ncbi:MAG TPA: sialidase family protein [Actinomycetota bacterium]|nr:sialidase family protein [Actinomycetota bacterium]
MRVSQLAKVTIIAGAVVASTTVAAGAPASGPPGERGSGGRAVVHHAGGRVLHSKKLEREAPDARLYRTGYPAFEPNLGVTDSGAVFYDGQSASGDPQVVRSTDHGATWEVVFSGHPTTLDPYLYVDPDTSRVFSEDYLVCHLFSYSDDLGDTWTTPIPTACVYNADHQTIFAGPPPAGGTKPRGYPNVVYLCSISAVISVASVMSACSKSLDGGRTFVPTGLPAYYDDPRLEGDLGIPGNCNGANGHGFVGPDGTVYLPRGWCGQPYLAMSRDEGLTWTRVQVAANGMPCCGTVATIPGVGTVGLHTHESGVVADDRGNVYYAWVAADRLPYLAISRDGGRTWGAPMMIGRPGVREALLPAIAIGSAGKIAVLYIGSTNSPWNGTSVVGGYADTTWNAYITMTVDALDRDPIFYSANLNATSQPLWKGSCGPDPERCGWGDFFDIRVGPDGTPWAAAVDLCNERGCSGFSEGVVGRLVGGPSLR